MQTAARGEFHPKPEPEQFDNEFKAKPAPKFGQPSTSVSARNSSMASGRRVTQIEAFSFDSRPRTRSRVNESNASMQTTKEAPAHNPGLYFLLMLFLIVIKESCRTTRSCGKLELVKSRQKRRRKRQASSSALPSGLNSSQSQRQSR